MGLFTSKPKVETRYFVVRKKDLSKLEEEVNEMISKGWVPVGGICTEPEGDLNGGWLHHLQSMWKPDA